MDENSAGGPLQVPGAGKSSALSPTSSARAGRAENSIFLGDLEPGTRQRKWALHCLRIALVMHAPTEHPIHLSGGNAPEQWVSPNRPRPEPAQPVASHRGSRACHTGPAPRQGGKNGGTRLIKSAPGLLNSYSAGADVRRAKTGTIHPGSSNPVLSRALARAGGCTPRGRKVRPADGANTFRPVLVLAGMNSHGAVLEACRTHR
jgi:hypothetical protein